MSIYTHSQYKTKIVSSTIKRGEMELILLGMKRKLKRRCKAKKIQRMMNLRLKEQAMKEKKEQMGMKKCKSIIMKWIKEETFRG